MNIEIVKLESGYQADCKDCPGSPPVGYGETEVEAVTALFYMLMFSQPGSKEFYPLKLEHSWLTYIKRGEPIVINGKTWKYPEGFSR